MLNIFKKNDRKLGVSEGKRLYDLPLDKTEGSGFLILLIALMSFLAIMAVASSFALSAMTDRWSSGLENKLTIEIPATNEHGRIRNADDMGVLAKKVASAINKSSFVKNVIILEEKDIQDLISPWLGENVGLKDIPLPSLLSVDLHTTTPKVIDDLKDTIQKISPNARLDTHEDWLNDLLRFTGAMQFAAMLITLIIGITTIIAVTGAIRSRMDVHRAEVELLYLMGAKDNYITKQFQRHALVLTLQGSLTGVIAGGITIGVISIISGETAAALLPNFKLSLSQIIVLCLLPLIACGISGVTARYTVLRSLAKMP